MKTFLIFIMAFTIGVLVAGIRMTDDKKEEMLKVKRVSDGVVLFVPKDDDRPYSIGDLYTERTPNIYSVGYSEEKFVVIDDIKIK